MSLNIFQQVFADVNKRTNDLLKENISPNQPNIKNESSKSTKNNDHDKFVKKATTRKTCFPKQKLMKRTQNSKKIEMNKKEKEEEQPKETKINEEPVITQEEQITNKDSEEQITNKDSEEQITNKDSEEQKDTIINEEQPKEESHDEKQEQFVEKVIEPASPLHSETQEYNTPSYKEKVEKDVKVVVIEKPDNTPLKKDSEGKIITPMRVSHLPKKIDSIPSNKCYTTESRTTQIHENTNENSVMKLSEKLRLTLAELDAEKEKNKKLEMRIIELEKLLQKE